MADQLAQRFLEVNLESDRLARDIHELFKIRPAGLLSDIDGTLAQISLDPAAAEVDPVIKASLLQLVRHVDVLGVVTGRSATEAARLVDIDGVIWLGNHGMERFDNGEVVRSPEALPYEEPLKRVLEEARLRLEDPLIYFENKGVTGSIHYRNTIDPSVAHQQIVDVVQPLVDQEGLRMSQGRMVVELRPPVPLNKGTALRSVVEQFGLKSILFMGDDVTDLDAMRVITKLRETGAIVGLSIGVVGPETPTQVTEESDRVVHGIEGISDLLADLVELYAQSTGQRAERRG